MKTADIAKVAGISHSTVYKILYLKDQKKYKFRAETVNKVKWLKNINAYLESLFSDKEFVRLCDLVIKRIGKKDSKKYITIIDLARSCKHLNQDSLHGIVKYIHCSAYDIFVDAEFYDMCMFAVRVIKNNEVREKAYEIAELSRAVRGKLKL